MTLRLAPLALLALPLVACGTDSVDRTGGHIEILSPAILTDTILCQKIIQVRVVDGKGDIVGNERAEITSALYLPETAGMTPVLVKWTEDGLFNFQISYGGTAGNADVHVRLQALDIDTTFYITILPGVAATVSTIPLDTVLMVGGTATYVVRAKDQAGNLRSVPGVVRPIDPGLPVDTLLGVATGGALGRYRLEAEVEEKFDTIEVSVVPDYLLAGISTSTTLIVRRKTDKSGNTLVRDGTGQEGMSSLGWGFAGTRELLYRKGVQARRLPENGGAETTVDVWSLIGSVGNLSPVRDSAWIFTDIYYSIFPYVGIARFHPDGSGQAILTPTNVPAAKASPAPNGTRFAYVYGDGAAFIRVRTVGGSDESWSVSGQWPRWSPTGERIAYLDEAGGHINLLDPADGSHTVLTSDSVAYALGRMSWTKDGLWLAARRGSGQWDLIRASDGFTLPVWTFQDLAEVMFEP